MAIATGIAAFNYKEVGAFLRAYGVRVTDDFLGYALQQHFPPPPPTSSPVILKADELWRNHISEAKPALGVPSLHDIFKTIGWSSRGAAPNANGRFDEWCGFFVGFVNILVGMNKGFNTAFFHVDNIASHYSYGKKRNVNPRRLDTEIKIDGKWVKIEEWHTKNGARRVWLDARESGGTMAVIEKVMPGDTFLIDWSGKNEADHTGIVRNIHKEDGKDRWLDTIEGNRNGIGPNGEIWPQAVTFTRYDLTVDGPKFYGFGRGSPLDIGTQEVR